MAIKKFGAFIAEASASDHVAQKDSDKEVSGLQPRAKGEEDFANQHMVQKTDYYSVPGQDHIFNGTIKEELEEEAELFEGKVLDGLKKIVDTKSKGKVKFANGKSISVDLTSASALVGLHGKLNDAMKQKMADDIEQSPERLMKLLDFAFSKGK
jgi:hypothetical protein